MRFLFIAPRFHSNQSDLVHKLIAEGHSVNFIVMGSSKSEDHSLLQPRVLEKTRLGKLVNKWRNPENDFSRYACVGIPKLRQLYQWLFEIKPDVTIVRGFLCSYILMALPYILFRSRVIVYTQGPKFRSKITTKLRLYYFFAFRVLRLRWFTTVDRKIDDVNVAKVDSGITFIPFFKQPCPRARNRGYQTITPRLLSIGKFQERKNFLNLIEAFSIIVKKLECTLTIIGENTTPKHDKYRVRLKNRITELGIAPRVTILQNMDFALVQEQYLKHDVFIMPSYNEPASIAQIEAMAYGLPVICCVDNGTAHYVKQGVNGLHCGSSTAELVEALEKLFDIPTQIEEWGQNSIALLDSEFSIDSSYEKLIELCQ
jgi:glycosyltransferase involved in cell wall biosynthesis